MKSRKEARPAQKLFDPELIRECGGDYGRDGDMYVFQGARFTMTGFMLKVFPLNALITEGEAVFYNLEKRYCSLSTYISKKQDKYSIHV